MSQMKSRCFDLSMLSCQTLVVHQVYTVLLAHSETPVSPLKTPFRQTVSTQTIIHCAMFILQSWHHQSAALQFARLHGSL